ncbi:hypothetical protein B0H13DRAFT_2485422 [Mycena leptocephala]|nr:hypothetical protein B0H13DRAFT_2485422 [Mycena leptocephala]
MAIGVVGGPGRGWACVVIVIVGRAPTCATRAGGGVGRASPSSGPVSRLASRAKSNRVRHRHNIGHRPGADVNLSSLSFLDVSRLLSSLPSRAINARCTHFLLSSLNANLRFLPSLLLAPPARLPASRLPAATLPVGTPLRPAPASRPARCDQHIARPQTRLWDDFGDIPTTPTCVTTQRCRRPRHARRLALPAHVPGQGRRHPRTAYLCYPPTVRSLNWLRHQSHLAPTFQEVPRSILLLAICFALRPLQARFRSKLWNKICQQRPHARLPSSSACALTPLPHGMSCSPPMQGGSMCSIHHVRLPGGFMC